MNAKCVLCSLLREVHSCVSSEGAQAPRGAVFQYDAWAESAEYSDDDEKHTVPPPLPQQQPPHVMWLSRRHGATQRRRARTLHHNARTACTACRRG
jgi:hypothetical protein